MQLLVPIASLSSVSIYRPTSFYDPSAAPIVPNTQNILDSLLKTKSNALVVVPIFLQQWALSPSAVDTLKTLQYVVSHNRFYVDLQTRNCSRSPVRQVFAGGPLAPQIGNAMVEAGVKLTSVYGATEFGAITHIFRNEGEQQLWDWLRFGQNSKIRWAPQDDGTYECQVLVRLDLFTRVSALNPSSQTIQTHQVSVENLPDVKGYATSDVFIKHPTIEGLWKM